MKVWITRTTPANEVEISFSSFREKLRTCWKIKKSLSSNFFLLHYSLLSQGPLSRRWLISRSHVPSPHSTRMKRTSSLIFLVTRIIQVWKSTHSLRCSWCHLPLACPGKYKSTALAFKCARHKRTQFAITLPALRDRRRNEKESGQLRIGLNMRAGITCVCAWRTISHNTRDGLHPSQSTRFKLSTNAGATRDKIYSKRSTSIKFKAPDIEPQVHNHPTMHVFIRDTSWT